MTFSVVIILASSLVVIFIPLIFIPYWTRKTESFGVSIPQDMFQSDALRTMRKKYTLWMTLFSLFTLMLFLVIAFFSNRSENFLAGVFSLIIVSYLIGSFFIYLRFHRKMKQKKATEKWEQKQPQQRVIHTKFREQRLTISNGFYLIPFGFTLFMGGLSIVYYDNLPAKIPMQYNFAGEVTRSVEKSLTAVLGLPVTLFVLIAIMLLINIVIAQTKQQISAENPEESLKRNVIFRRRWSIFLYVMTLLLTALFAMIQMNFFDLINQTIFLYAPHIGALGMTIGAIALAVTTGQGGSRVKLTNETTEEVIDQDDDRYWKLGQFYYNKADPALFLEKRFGIGWTINWARPLAWISLIVLMVLVTVIPILFMM